MSKRRSFASAWVRVCLKGRFKAVVSLSKKRLDNVGRALSGACVTLIVLLVATLVFMVAQHGLATFFVDGISPTAFFTGTTWNPHQADASGAPTVGALPMIVGSFSVTLLSTLLALPFALGSAIFVVEISPRFGRTVFQPVVELLVGIPSVVYGLIGLTIVVAWCRGWSNTTGFGIFSGSIVLAVMILPTITSLSIDALTAVPKAYREGAYGVGASRWQTGWHVVLRAAMPSLCTAVVLGMTRAFGEALAVQMVIGNAAQVPDGLFTPASTLTSVLTMGIGNEMMGTVYSDVLWSLALLLLAMSFVFISVIHFIERKGGLNANGR